MKRGIKKFLEACCVTGTILIGLAFIAFVAYLIALGLVSFIKGVKLRPADLPADTPSEGVAWIMPEAEEVPVWLSPVCAGEAETAVWLDSYTEGDGPAPEWWNPGEPMSAEWEDHFPDAAKMVDGQVNGQSYCQSDTVGYIAHPPIGIDPGGIDWNICTELVGWNGHRMEIWEMDMFARIAYLEFRSCGQECREAGVDAILRLWESEYYSKTISGTLSAKTESGAWAYSTYPGMWEESYDPDLLAEMKEICENRFFNGPVWTAPFFRLDYFHDWAKPCYQIENVCFSTGWGWD